MVEWNNRNEDEEMEFLDRDRDHPGEARTAELKSMADEILTTYYDVVLAGLNESLRAGEISAFLNMPVLSETLSLFHVSDVQLYDVNRTDMLADIQLWVSVCTDVEEETDAELGATLRFAFSEETTVRYESTWQRTSPPDRERYRRMDARMVPFCANAAVERTADDLWRNWHLPGLTDPTERDPMVLAKRMGIAIDRVHAVPGTRSVLYFKGAEVMALPPEGKGTEILRLEQDTLFLAVTGSGELLSGKRELFAHCVLYALYYKFCRFQGLSGDDLTQLGRKWMPEERAREMAKVLGWVRARPQRIACSLMLPKDYMEASISKWYPVAAARTRPLGYHVNVPFILSEIAKQLHGENQGITYRNFRSRFIHLGYPEGYGIFNSTDFHSTDPYGFSDESLMSGQYTLSIGERMNMLRLFHADEEFRQVMESGDFVFADGLVARNHRDYVRDTPYGCRLTPDANDLADACCLRFSTRWNSERGCMGFRFGKKNMEWMRDTLEKTAGERYQVEVRASREEQVERLRQMKRFHKAFSDLVHTRTSAEKLAAATTIPLRRILDLMQSEREGYCLDEVIMLCIGLHLEPPLSLALVEKAGLSFAEGDGDYRRAILCCLFRDSVPELCRWQEKLAENRHCPVPVFSFRMGERV
ncbi:MAG: hypothetical protein IJ088_06300 [Clostridia bacterium]|nr:hypothetical protein [Clostridia bacterium]